LVSVPWRPATALSPIYRAMARQKRTQKSGMFEGRSRAVQRCDRVIASAGPGSIAAGGGMTAAAVGVAPAAYAGRHWRLSAGPWFGKAPIS